MLFSEMVRRISDEEQLENDSGPYDTTVADLHDWTMLESKTITLPKAQLIYVEWATTAKGSNPNCASRLTVNNVPIVSTGSIPSVDVPVVRKAYVYLLAGAYILDFETSQWKTPASDEYVRISNIVVGRLNFADLSGLTVLGDLSTYTPGEETAMFTQNIIVPSARKLPCGKVKQYTLLAYFYLNRSYFLERNNLILHPGEGAVADKINFRVYINDVQQVMTARAEDYNANADNPDYGAGCFGMLSIPVDADSVKALKVTVEDEAADGTVCSYYVQWVLCPWIIPAQEYEPITFSFSDGSTVYITTEPLDANPTKTVKIGKARVVSFGDATDNYYSTSGEGIHADHYTFEFITVAGCLMFISGFGGCISVVGADMR
jgi:hypothetical protein